MRKGSLTMRHAVNFRVASRWMLTAFALALCLAVVAPAWAQEAVTAADVQRYSMKELRTSYFVDGKLVDEVAVPGRRPKGVRMSAVALPEPNPAAGINVLGQVPAFDWAYGCSATSAAMMMGYYDRHDYTNMYAGPAGDGVCPLANGAAQYWPSGECPLSATHMGYDDRLIRGHVDDYWVGYGEFGNDPFFGKWSEHVYGDCTGDYMGTNQDYWWNSDGSTSFWYNNDGSRLIDFHEYDEWGYRDGCHGMRLFGESRGYTVVLNFNQYILGYDGLTQGFTYVEFKAEIDAGRPVLIHVSGHTMLGVGYNDASGNLIYIHDTWDNSMHSMQWGGSYSGLEQYGVTVFQMLNIVPDVTPLDVTVPSPVPIAYTGEAYSIELTVSGGTGPYVWTLEEGTLPDGLTWAANGDGTVVTISGTPTTVESQALTFGVVDSDDGVGSAQFTLGVVDELTIESESPLPLAAIGAAYSFTFAAGGGTEPYTWSIVEAGDYVESQLETGTWIGGGEAQGWQADDASWPLNIEGLMGWKFPYFGTEFSTVNVCSNGFLDFVSTSTEWDNSEVGLTRNYRICPLWDDLTTAHVGYDIYVNTDAADYIVIRWLAKSLWTQDATNVEVMLYRTGEVQFNYGIYHAGVYPVIGVGGAACGSTVSSLCWRATIPANRSVRFTPSFTLPQGLSWNQETGVLSGVPVGPAETVAFTVRVRDDGFTQQTVTKPFSLTVSGGTPSDAAPTLTLPRGFNFVPMAVSDPRMQDAQSLCDAISDCAAVWKWDADNQCWSGHPNGGPNNFAVSVGESYLVAVTYQSAIRLTGEWQSGSVALKKGFNIVLLPRAKEALATAEDLAKDIPNCLALWEWQADAQSWNGHPKGGPNNFDVAVGCAYLVYVNEAGTW